MHCTYFTRLTLPGELFYNVYFHALTTSSQPCMAGYVTERYKTVRVANEFSYSLPQPSCTSHKLWILYYHLGLIDLLVHSYNSKCLVRKRRVLTFDKQKTEKERLCNSILIRLRITINILEIHSHT